ncbi:MAG: hemerythrin domain-containing protein [Euryarchaeota archaeon]|nr:hemerythrin domain-containing protein [Euryarchaeota archaeon]
MKPTSILDIMVKDHGKIITLLNDVEKNMNNDVLSMMKAFDSFEWALEKHIFTEEKAIYTSYNPVNIREGYKMVPELVQDHNELLNRLRVMRFDILKKHRCDFEGFKCSLLDHKTFEEEQLYPRLDEELTNEQKLMIVSRIKEIV